MENEVFERDYSQLPPLHSMPEFQADLAILKHAADCGLIKEYEATVKAMPKYIVPEMKTAYDDLLSRLDELALEARGTVRGVVDYEEWQASITVTLPILRFIEPFGTLLMADIALSADSVTINSDKQGNIQMKLLIPYFMDIGNKEQVMDDLIEQDERLIELITTIFTDSEEGVEKDD